MVNFNPDATNENSIFYKMRSMDGIECLLSKLDKKPKYSGQKGPEEASYSERDNANEKMDAFMKNQRDIMKEMVHRPTEEEVRGMYQDMGIPYKNEATTAEHIASEIKANVNSSRRSAAFYGSIEKRNLRKALQRWAR